MSYSQDYTGQQRYILTDLVRSFALLGIVLVNVAYFAYPGDITYHAGGLNSSIDYAAYSLVNTLFLFKSYTLFSFMFGVGLAHQMLSAERRRISFKASYFKRMAALLALGMLHVTFAFYGDILIVYALLGMLLYLFRNKNQKKLVRTGCVLVGLQVLVAVVFASGLYSLEARAPEQYIMTLAEMERQRSITAPIYASGDFSEVVQQRWRDWISVLLFALPLQGPGVLGFFLFGLAAVRAGVLSNVQATLWENARKLYLPFGLLISVLGAYVYSQADNPLSGTSLIGYALLLFAAPFSSLGYIGLVAKWSEGPDNAYKIFFARAGTSTLTAYLLQSLILSLVFCGYGLGFFAKLDALTCVTIALITGLITVAFVSLWRDRFKQGPMEALLRHWTYLGNRQTPR